jgi:acyl dehydratase
LKPVLLPQAVITTGFKMGVNYGCNKVRFMSPVYVGSKLRMGVKLLSVEDIPGGVQSTYELVLECEGAAKPSCVAECIYRSYE